MLIPLIDQFTLVLKPEKTMNLTNWVKQAEQIIDEFLELSCIDQLFVMQTKGTLPSGYNIGFTTSESAPFYFSIAYNDESYNMGVIVKFSAQAWYFYKKYFSLHFNQNISLWSFMKRTDSKKYNIRLSQVDVAVDYIDEDIDIQSIYNSLMQKRTVIRYSNGKINRSTISPHIPKNLDVETIYIGSRKKNVHALMRIYNKQQEQRDCYGLYKDFAETVNNWIRYEVRYRGHYAHQLSKKLTKIKTDFEEQSLIVSSILDRYSFCYVKTNKFRPETKSLNELLSNTRIEFTTPNTRIHALDQSHDYLINNSGLLSYLYKLKKCFGEESVKVAMDDFIEALNTYSPNDDVIRWLDQHLAYYEDNKPRWLEKREKKEV